jgi:hypothetical protein
MLELRDDALTGRLLKDCTAPIERSTRLRWVIFTIAGHPDSRGLRYRARKSAPSRAR